MHEASGINRSHPAASSVQPLLNIAILPASRIMVSFPPVAACFIFGWAVIASALSPQKIQWVNCSEHVPNTDIALDLSGVNLSALPSTLQCGRLVVPMDYAKPISPTNNITLGLAMYRPQKPKGVIF